LLNNLHAVRIVSADRRQLAVAAAVKGKVELAGVARW
jgi:hypothetical protein